ncbi:uncharacterized protein C5orf47 homolog isoform X1 [Peromyscus californicus insignis]|uniref:uncharacterized protein C5orf47 homolog isoform X1 n=1 Tax=Peromyscus californicus insignis TaxID=564181 RepID=UPI0022A7B177|nr:uncharacterized protein C5orf47 homolog isoform X1 [Peromyscus californicus insignis]
MVPAGGHHRPDRPPVIYVTRFASHRPGVWPLRGPRGLRLQGPGPGACWAVERAAVESGPPGGELPTGSRARVAAAAAAATPASTSFELRRSGASRAPRGLEQAARAGGGLRVSEGWCRVGGCCRRRVNAAFSQSGSRQPSFPCVCHALGLNQNNAAKEFDFPIPLNEASKIMKERKKVLVWKKVHKVISRMIAENEKYRHRLKCQNLSSEIRVNTR